MREILFRGKRLDNGEWIEGDLKHDDLDFDTDIVYIYFHNKIEGRYETAEVDPATVGQYTGLKDINGKRIFEGDIVKTVYKTGCVEYCEKQARYNIYLKSKDRLNEMNFMKNMANECEVIGNIHDEVKP